jgi:tetratricopeptide (TPR) repeat protein
MDRDKLLQSAARAYQYAQSLKPDNLMATLELAACYREYGEFAKATSTLHDAAKLHPQSSAIHTQLGEVYHAQGRFDEALAEFKTALRLDPGDFAAHNGCGVVNAAVAQARGPKGSMARARAIAHFRRSLELSGDQPQVRRALQRLEPYQWTVVVDQPPD